jgi:anti-sigma factor RsiW
MGLRCRRVRQRCWHYLDGTLSAQARARVERHLVGCGECRAAFAQAAFILESLQKGLPIETDSLCHLPRTLRGYLHRRRNPSRWRWSVLLPLLVALIGLVGGIGLVRLVPSATRPLLSSPQAEPSASAPIPSPKVNEAHGGIPHGLDAPSPLPQRGDARHPKRVEARSPSKSATPQKAGRARRTKAPSPRKQIARPSHSPAPVPTQLPEGTVEVYDPSGQLVKRDRVRGSR